MLPIAAVISTLFAAVASAAAFHAGAFPATRWSHSSVVLRYESPVDITVGEPVIVELTVDNQREDAIRVDLGFNRTENFVVTVKGPAGRPHTAALLQSPLPDRAGRGGRVLVSPSQTFSHQLVLNQWFRFDQAGIYVVEIRLKTGITTAAGIPIDVPTPGHFTIDVRPRNEWALKATCERLAQTVIETADVAQRLDAARALSYVADPVAVSYIASVIASTDAVDSLLIPALARIGGSEAWETLKRLQNSPDRDRASLASRFLRMRIAPRD